MLSPAEFRCWNVAGLPEYVYENGVLYRLAFVYPIINSFPSPQFVPQPKTYSVIPPPFKPIPLVIVDDRRMGLSLLRFS